MKLAKIPAHVLTTPISGTIQTGYDAYGTPTTQAFSGKCRFVDKMGRHMTADGVEVRYTGVCYMDGNIPLVEGGACTVDGKGRTITGIDQHRNPDGTIHHTKIYLR